MVGIIPMLRLCWKYIWIRKCTETLSCKINSINWKIFWLSCRSNFNRWRPIRFLFTVQRHLRRLPLCSAVVLNRPVGCFFLLWQHHYGTKFGLNEHNLSLYTSDLSAFLSILFLLFGSTTEPSPLHSSRPSNWGMTALSLWSPCHKHICWYQTILAVHFFEFASGGM